MVLLQGIYGSHMLILATKMHSNMIWLSVSVNSPELGVYAYGAAQVKKAMEVSDFLAIKNGPVSCI